MMQEMHKILDKYQLGNVVESEKEKRECNQKMDSMSKDLKTMEKAVEIKEKEMTINQMPKEVKTDKLNFWFIEQEITNLVCGLQWATVTIHDKFAGNNMAAFS